MAKLGIIPARYASTRFPGKPLIDINGKSMIQRVYEQACSAASLDQVVIATDDERIITEIKRFGGEYAKTRTDHQSGTDRCAEVATNFPGFDVIINIQGDEPYIDPVQIDLLSSCFEDPQVKLATLVKKIYTDEELFNQNIPKVVLNANQEAIYFSRQTIPFQRNIAPQDWLKTFQFYKHIGIYGYTTETLLRITQLKPSSLELAESLEQLRWLENGYKIKTKVTDLETFAVDTPEDLEKIIRIKGN
ncbi:3-deoxy-manno-octulosonate cytidylyltransferase (CMP-KDO synthetase) [Pedobacter cryoconitis]|uniref:3-deoxy-manno-octulosonate cytidylyltransferase n=1 Tax=Pedobacter cryoconitis TaxID=188932 RepID=A0A7W9DJQ6_9SPHI|nr:3-deoxy-manno-octulosonate cytidylyltransferase [Pedobacter cryoconitis]MBB5620380.1 3-deoxy-manno-octulosonate cytidylyltransferase (CMP-KDO synthetase) [Pedobacter cryoconitis]